ncbi:MAG TPA: hypothetical protein VEC99_08765 [Clostridia bacterium]|nr:hypothetical protein [Clostridia bacterium]
MQLSYSQQRYIRANTVLRGLILLVLVLAALALSLFLLSSFKRTPLKLRTTLPDGTQIKFLGTSVGTAQFSTDKPWLRFARQHLPPFVTRWLPPAISGSCGHSSNSVTVYVEATTPAGVTANPPTGDHYATEDDSGFRYPEEGGYCSFSGGAGRTIYGFTLRALPRREEAFQFHFLDYEGKPTASLRLPNPVRGPFPEWRAAPLPLTCTNGPVTLTLESLEEGGSDRWRFIQPKWRVTSSDTSWTNAQPWNPTCSDPTGNEGAFLSKREPVWKMRTLMHRQRREDFAPDERLILTNLVIPSAGQFTSLDHTARLRDALIKVQLLAGPGELVITNGMQRVMISTNASTRGHSTTSGSYGTWETWRSRRPYFLIEVQGAKSDDQLRFYATYERKPPKPMESGGYHGTSNGNRTYQVDFTPVEGAKTVDLEIIFSRPLAFEFMVNSAEIRPASQ